MNAERRTGPFISITYLLAAIGLCGFVYTGLVTSVLPENSTGFEVFLYFTAALLVVCAVRLPGRWGEKSRILLGFACCIPQTVLSGILLSLSVFVVLVMVPITALSFLFDSGWSSMYDSLYTLFALWWGLGLTFLAHTVNWLLYVRVIYLPTRPGGAAKETQRYETVKLLVFGGGFYALHQIYLGRYKKGVLYLCTFGLFGVGVIRDLSRLVSGKLVDAEGKSVPVPGPPPVTTKPLGHHPHSQQNMGPFRQVLNDYFPNICSVGLYYVLPVVVLVEMLPFPTGWSLPLAIFLGLIVHFMLFFAVTLIYIAFTTREWKSLRHVPQGVKAFWLSTLRIPARLDFGKATKCTAGQGRVFKFASMKVWTDSDREEELAGLCRDTLEETLKEFRKLSGLTAFAPPPSNLRVFLFQHHEHFFSYLKAYSSDYSGAAGLYLSMKPPRVLISLEYSDLTDSLLQDILAHEFAHALHMRNDPQQPDWFLEGVAQFIATRVAEIKGAGFPILHIATQQNLLYTGSGLLAGRLRPPSRKHSRSPKLADTSFIFMEILFYQQSDLLMRYLFTHKTDALRREVAGPTCNCRTVSGFQKVFGLGPDEAMSLALDSVPPRDEQHVHSLSEALQTRLDADIFPALDDPNTAELKQRVALAWIFQEERVRACDRLERYLQHAEGYLRDEAKAIRGLLDAREEVL